MVVVVVVVGWGGGGTNTFSEFVRKAGVMRICEFSGDFHIFSESTMHSAFRNVVMTRLTSVRMYLWWSLCALYLHACQVRVAVDDSGLCCSCVTYFDP